MKWYLLGQGGFGFRKKTQKECTTKKKGFIIRENTKCGDDVGVTGSFLKESEEDAWIGCDLMNCKMIEYKGTNIYKVCFSKPVEDLKTGSCAWIKGRI